MGKKLDLTNQKFGKLTAIKPTDKRNSSGQIIWECICDCGNTFYAVGADLKRNKITHCDKCNIKKNQYISIEPGDYINHKRIIKDTGLKTLNGTIIWECQCDCGNIYNLPTSEIHRFQKCSKCKQTKEDLLGMKFGKLTVIEEAPTKDGKAHWLCQCECGGTIIRSTYNLKHLGKYQGCGCTKSLGEEAISKLLLDNNINFTKQKTFDNCKFPDTHYHALFDFYVDNKYIIEYDGIQHFKPVGGWSNEEAVKHTQEHDQYKNQYCKEHNIPLIRIPYTHYNDLCIDDLKLETTSFLFN